MARIIYKPHCSECGEVINDEVMYETINLKNFIGDNYTNIYPMKCKTCGAYFNCIEIKPPTNLTKENV